MLDEPRAWRATMIRVAAHRRDTAPTVRIARGEGTRRTAGRSLGLDASQCVAGIESACSTRKLRSTQEVDRRAAAIDIELPSELEDDKADDLSPTSIAGRRKPIDTDQAVRTEGSMSTST